MREIGTIADGVMPNSVATLAEENARLRAQLHELGARRSVDLLLHDLDGVLDAMNEGLQVLDRSYRYLYVNEAAARHGQREKRELLGRTLLEMYPGVEKTEMFASLERCMRERQPERLENEFTFPDGNKQWFELRFQPVSDGVLILSVDVSERRRLEVALSQAQKMEALGRLAGGIAHDFNNLLTVIISYADFMATGTSDPTQQQDAQEIRAAAERGTLLTRQLLALSQRQVIVPRTVDPNAVIEGLVPMIRRLVGEAITVHLNLNAEGAAVHVDPSQLDQVLLTLAANARDAMPSGGRLVVRTENVVLDETYAALHMGVARGPHVLIAVTDTGHGMSPDVLTRIFEPFLAGRSKSQGTGLGLATAHGVVRQNGGHVWVYSEPGQGTTFKLYFPLVDARGAASRVETKPPAPSAEKSQGVVMVVEDQPALRMLCVRALKERGYTVFEAEGSSEALRLAERYSGPIDLVLSDVVMPEPSGPDMMEQLRIGRPELAVLYMSGYMDHDLLARIPRDRFLPKPFTPEILLAKVHEVLVAR